MSAGAYLTTRTHRVKHSNLYYHFELSLKISRLKKALLLEKVVLGWFFERGFAPQLE